MIGTRISHFRILEKIHFGLLTGLGGRTAAAGGGDDE
jgi:hypothetical protein